MPLSRRSFVGALGLAGAGLVSAPLVGARGREAMAAALGDGAPDPLALEPTAARVIRLSSNENPRGPCDAALGAIRAALGEASRYPGAGPEELRRAVAAANGVGVDHVLLGCGSTEILRMAVHAFTSPTRPLVVGAPTFEEPALRAKALGVEVRAVPVRAGDLRLNLDAMAAQAGDVGLVFICNPNNPTGTLHSASAIADCVRRVLAASPGTMVVIDEAYHEYVEDPAYATALPLALEHPRVIVSRTFSKAYGIAGLRVGYAIARPETREAMARHQLGLAINVLGASAARAALAEPGLAARERRLNHEARAFTRRFFESAGYAVAPSEANFVMVDIRRDVRAFQAACRTHDVLVGRPFPPLATHLRVSIGTMDEMRAAVDVFRHVLASPAS